MGPRSRGGRACLAVVAGCGVVLSGCEADDVRARADVAALVRAIRVVREAPHDAKRGPLGALRAVACRGDGCDARRVCIEAYALHVSALESLAQASASVDEGLVPFPTGSAALLERAKHELERSAVLASDCVNVEGELARRYRIE